MQEETLQGSYGISDTGGLKKFQSASMKDMGCITPQDPH